ncbi:MAG: hypothetical protein KME03_18075 [Aphanocapsa lilacina HA4352-LM1]|jgi:hypothetical protein|nr:hypothetical protein [Aphanocapsa lilacina HA4352-LM1]
MAGQMCWLSKSVLGGDKVLHLRLEAGRPWLPYIAYSMLAVPDHKIPKGSKGYATFQKLLKAGWQVVPSGEQMREPGWRNQESA